MLHPTFPRRLALALALGISLAGRVASAAGGFEGQRYLDPASAVDAGSDETPWSASDGAGNRVLVWSSNDNVGCTTGTDFDVMVATSADDGATWSAARPLNENAGTDSGGDVAPRVETDGLGNWLVVWASNDDFGGTLGSDFDVFASRSTDNGATWTYPSVANSWAAIDNRQDYEAAFARDDAGRWILAFTSRGTGGTFGVDTDVFSTVSTDAGATWSVPIAVNAADADLGDDALPTIATDRAGTWVAAWSSFENTGFIGPDEDLFFSRSTDAGASWEPYGILNGNAVPDFTRDFSVVVDTDGAGVWLAVWITGDPTVGFGFDNDVAFSRSTDAGATWSYPAALNSGAATDQGGEFQPALRTDRLGTWVAAWFSDDPLGGEIDGDGDLFVSFTTNAGLSWTPAGLLNANAGFDEQTDQWPNLSYGNGVWLAAWNTATPPPGATVPDNDIVVARSLDLAPVHDAAFVEHDIPSAMPADELPEVEIELSNTGLSTWTPAGGFRLEAVVDTCSLMPAPELALDAGTSVPPGAEYKFLATLSAPSSPGVCTLELRMRTDPGTNFGETLALNVSIFPRQADDATETTDTLESQLLTDRATTATIVMRNTGDLAWSDVGGYSLLVRQDSCGIVGAPRIPLPPATTVPLHGEHVFAIPLNAPPDVGVCFLEFQMENGSAQIFGESVFRIVNVLPSAKADFAIPEPVDPERAAEDSLNDDEPSLATDGLGTWIVFWSSFNRMRLARSTDDGASWEDAIEFPQGGGGPTLATDGACAWVAAWWSNDSLLGTIGGDLDILFARSTDDGATWSPAAVLNSNAPADSRGDFFPRVVHAGGAAWLATWTSTHDFGGTIGTDGDVLFARSTDGGASWGPASPLAANAATDSGTDDFASIATDGAGAWLAAWESDDTFGGTLGSDNDVIFATSTDGGVAWSAPLPLNPFAAGDAGGDTKPAPASDGAGRWVVVWRSQEPFGGPLGSDDDLLAVVTTDMGATWTPPVVVNAYAYDDDTRDESVPRLATDGLGTWLTVWPSHDPNGGGFSQDYDLFASASTDGGLNWSAPGAAQPNAASDIFGDFRASLAAGSAGRWLLAWQTFEPLVENLGIDGDIVAAPTSDVLRAPKAWATLSASTIPASLGTDQVLPVTATLRNAGSSVWSPSTGERLAVVDDPCGLADMAAYPVPAGKVVAPGLDVQFAATLRAPSVGGACTLHLRMEDGAGVRFGPTFFHNIAIVPRASRDAIFVGDTLPFVAPKTKPVAVSFDVLNSGQTAWSRGAGYALEVVADTCNLFPDPLLELPPGPSIAPGQQTTFSTAMETPLWPGFCFVELRMTQTGVGNFGQSLFRNVLVEFGVAPAGVVNDSATTDIRLDVSPSLATDSAGVWISAWHTQENLFGTIGEDPDIAFSRSTDAGETWETVAVLNDSATTDSGADTNPAIAHGGGDLWIAVWQSTEALGALGSDSDIFQSHSSDWGLTWSPTRALNVNAIVDSGNDRLPHVAVGPTGSVLAAWSSNDDLGGTVGSDYDIFVARTNDVATTWTAPIALNANAASDAGDDGLGAFARGGEPFVAANGPGAWIVAWDTDDPVGGPLGADPDVVFARSTDDGATWSPPEPLNANAATDAGGDFQPRLATDGAGVWIAAWTSCETFGGLLGPDSDVLLARSTDGALTWSAPREAADFLRTDATPDGAGDGAFGGPVGLDLATDGAGRWIVVWDSGGSPPGPSLGSDGDILHVLSGDNGLTWSAPAPFNVNADEDSGEDRTPRVATDGAGNWIGVWSSHENLEGAIGSDRDILYARSAVLPRPLDAAFVASTAPAQAPLSTAVPFEIRMRNTGETAWSAGGYFLALIADPCGMLSVTSIPVAGTVERGDEFAFATTLATPPSPGACTLEFAMNRGGLEFFGEVALVSVEVLPVVGNGSLAVGHTLPATMLTDDSLPVSVVMRNTGTNVWDDDYRLAVTNDPCGLFPTNRLFMPPGTTIASGQEFVFQRTIVAPATPGVCDVSLRMVEELVEFFGDQVDVSIQVNPRPALDAIHVGDTIPTQLQPSRQYGVSFRLRNTGDLPWSADDGFALVPTIDACGTISALELPIPGTTVVNTLEEILIPATLTTPPFAGDCTLIVRMRRAPNDFFGEALQLNLTIDPAPPNEARGWELYE